MALSTTAAGKLAALIQEIDEEKGMEFERLSAELSAVFGMMVEEREARRGPDVMRSTNPAYVSLRAVLDKAYAQAAEGKGKDRHTKGEDHAFIDQPICELQRLFSNDYAFGQAAKKMEESKRLPKDKALAELLGAINYIAAAYIVREEQDDTGPGND